MKYLIILLLTLNTAFAADGLHSFVSNKSFEETTQKVESFIKDKGLKLFAVVNHSENASGAGLKLAANTLFIFGNPKVGTPLMQVSPTMGIDLPVKVLVYKDKNDNVMVTYSRPGALAKKHVIEKDHASFKKMGKVLGLLEKVLLSK